MIMYYNAIRKVVRSLNRNYLVDRRERQLNSYIVSGKSYAGQLKGISLPIFNMLCQSSKYKSLHGTI